MNSVSYTRPVNLPQTVDLSGNTVIAFPTITESNPQHLLRSDPSTIYSYPSASSRQPSPAASPNEKKIFTVTIAEDPLSDV
jgi:hypothetical protein